MNFKAHQPYRWTSVMLLDLRECHHEPLDLCGASLQIEKMTRLYQGVDQIKVTYGKHTLFLGLSFYAHPPVYDPRPYPPPEYRRPPVRR
jgi:hypothetical protein